MSYAPSKDDKKVCTPRADATLRSSSARELASLNSHTFRGDEARRRLVASTWKRFLEYLHRCHDATLNALTSQLTRRLPGLFAVVLQSGGARMLQARASERAESDRCADALSLGEAGACRFTRGCAGRG